MNENILQQLYDGKIYPDENIGVGNAELQKANEKVAEEKAKFIKSLSDVDRANFLKLDDLQDESAALYGYESFAYGFRLAVSLILESASGGKGNVQKDEN